MAGLGSALRPPLPTRWRSPLRAVRSLSRDRLIALAGLALLGAGGLVLRLEMAAAYRPAFLGYPDTHFYIQGANAPLFSNPMQPIGYEAFLQATHDLGSTLQATMRLQHGLGLATALLLFLAVRRIGGPAWLGLAPAAVVALGGDQLFFEHAVLSETLFGFLCAAALYAGARCLDGGWAWPVAAGALCAARRGGGPAG